MSFLDGLFVNTSTELGVAPGLITFDATIEVGWIYQVGDSEGPCVLSLAPVPIADVVGHRVAVKVVRDGGGVMVIVPEGMTIEGDGGAVSGQVEVEHVAGNYREWICNASGLWLLVAGAAGGGGGDTGGGDAEPNPHVWTHTDGGLDELDVTGLSGVLADPQPPAPHAATHAAGGSDALVLGLGYAIVPFTLRKVSTGVDVAEEIGVLRLAGSRFPGCTFAIVAEMDVSVSGQTAVLQVVSLADSSVVATLQTSALTTTKCTAAVPLPAAETLYSARLKRQGGSSSEYVSCRSVIVEVIHA